MQTCEICGRSVEKLRTIKINSTILKVCNNCMKFGKEIIEKRSISVEKRVKTYDIEIPEIVENYGDIIRKARERMGMTREQLAKILKEKESVIARIENYEMVPDDKLARKLEKVLKIKLFTYSNE